MWIETHDGVLLNTDFISVLETYEDKDNPGTILLNAVMADKEAGDVTVCKNDSEAVLKEIKRRLKPTFSIKDRLEG